jgi:translocation and assembly module TamB
MPGAKIRRFVAAVVGTVVAFLLALAGGAVLHLDLPGTRRVAAGAVNEALAPLFRGRLIVQRIGGVRVFPLARAKVVACDAELLDPEGREVAHVRNVSAEVDVAGLLRGLRRGGVRLLVRELHVGDAALRLDTDAAGQLDLVRAFEPKTPSPPTSSSTPAEVTLAGITLKHGWVHGALAVGIDAEVADARGEVDVARRVRVKASAKNVLGRALPLGANAEGEATFTLLGEALGGTFDGNVSGIPTKANATLKGPRLDASVDLPRVTHDRVRALVPAAPLHGEVALRAEAHGDLPRLAITAHGTSGGGSVDAQGDVTVAGTIALRARAQARDIDVRAVSPELPPSRISADVEADLLLSPGGLPQGTYAVDVLPGAVAGQRIPRARLRGSLERSAVSVNGRIDEPGAPIELSATLHHGILAFDVSTTIADLERVPRVGNLAKGSGSLKAKGTLSLADRAVDAEFEARADDVAKEGVTAGALFASGVVKGNVQRPFVDAQLSARDLAYETQRFSQGKVQVRGPITSPVAFAILHGETGTPRIEATAALELGKDVLLHHARLTVVRPGATVVTRADRIRVGKDAIDVEEAVVEGLGDEPTLVSVRRDAKSIRFRLYAKGLELARAARLLELNDQHVAGGRVDTDIDLLVLPGGVHGTVNATATGVTIDQVKSADAALHATFDGTRITMGLHGKLGETGHVDLHTSTLALGGSPLSLASWSKVTGRVHADIYADVESLGQWLAAGTPVTLARGLLMLEADVTRDPGHTLPDVNLSLRGRQVSVTGQRPVEHDAHGQTFVGAAPWRIPRMDVALDARLHGETGHSEIAAKLTDPKGPLLTVAVDGDVPYGAILSRPGDALAMLTNTEMNATVALPRRKLDDLPSVLHLRGLTGEAELRASLRGKLSHPEFHLEGHTYGVKRQAGNKPPTGIDLIAHYLDDEAHGEAHVRVRQSEVLSAGFDAHGNAGALLSGTAPWDASAEVKATRFPLDALSFFSDRQVRGEISGEALLKNYHRDARASVRLDLANLQVGRTRYRSGLVSVDVDQQGTRAVARLDQKDGYAEAHADLGTTWGAELAPSLDATKDVTGEIHAKGFRTGALLPFLQPHVSQLGGRVEADARIRLPPSGKGHPTMEGTLTLTRGSIELPALGEQIRDARAKVTIDKDGLVRIDDVAGRAAEGRFSANGAIRLQGVQVVGATASVRIPRGDPVPVMMNGEPLAKVYGDTTMNAMVTRRFGPGSGQAGDLPSADRTTMNVEVGIPNANVRMPDVSSHQVMDLDPAEKVRIGVRRTGGVLRLVTLGPDAQSAEKDEDAPRGEPMTTVVGIHLGREIELRRGGDLRVTVEGEPRITLRGGETKIEGQLRLVTGFIEIQGRRFKVEKGTITWSGDAKNPIANVTASYQAPEGTAIYADFIGPIETGKVTLRSSPPRSQADILALILYGTDLGATAPSRQASGAAQAVGASGALASQGLNKAIEGLTGSDFATVRVDTSNQANPRPEVEFQIARDISLQLATVIGRLPIDQLDRNFFTIDWRFRRNWLLSTTFGDKGSSMFDLVWQRRY